MIDPVAHSVGTGGGNLETIALSAGIILLGLAFLVQKSLDKRVSIGLVVLGVVAFVGAFTFLKDVGGGEGTIVVQGQEYTEDELTGAITALCTAREAAADDPDEAEEQFLNRAHIPLHVIAAAVQDENASQASRLLEAKTTIEEEFVGDRDPEALEGHFTELIEATADALGTLEVPASTC